MKKLRLTQLRVQSFTTRSRYSFTLDMPLLCGFHEGDEIPFPLT